MATAPDPTFTASTDVLVAFARLEAKVDVALAQHGADIRELRSDATDHEQRLRTQEARPDVPPAVDERLRAVENRSIVTPAGLWAAVSSAAVLVFGAVQVVQTLTH